MIQLAIKVRTPDDGDCVNTGDLVTLFCDTWNKACSDLAGNASDKGAVGRVKD